MAERSISRESTVIFAQAARLGGRQVNSQSIRNQKPETQPLITIPPKMNITSPFLSAREDPGSMKNIQRVDILLMRLRRSFFPFMEELDPVKKPAFVSRCICVQSVVNVCVHEH
jgi:hypothetical protein